MKTLTLLRHAKSGWDDTVQRDVDRPLNAKGRRAAQTIGRFLKREATMFDYILASPAVRVQQTLDEVGTGLGGGLSSVCERRIYLASASTLLDLVRDLDDAHDAVLLVGHNPGLEDLVLMLVPDAPAGDGAGPRGEVEEKYPTASLAELHFAIDHWADAREGGATLRRFVRPRDLDPSLGPDTD